jgi:hypothetical protein
LTAERWRREVEPALGAHTLRTNEEFANRRDAVVARGRNLARWSPYGAFSFVVGELAGVGPLAQARFEAAVERYRREFKEFLRAQQEAGREREVAASEVPAFGFVPEPLGSVLRRTLADLVALGLATLLVFTAAYLRMLRYDVR